MARVAEDFPLQCPNCGGDIRLISFITDLGPIRRILTHLGERLEPPPLSPARGPPTNWGELVQVHDDVEIVQIAPDFTARDRHPLALRAAVIRHPQAGLRKGYADGEKLLAQRWFGGSVAAAKQPDVP